MKQTCLILLISLALAACKHTLTQQEKKLCGKWMKVGEKYNQEWFDFKSDGTFIDERFKTTVIKLLPKAVTFTITGNQLILKYRGFIYLPYTAHYNIISMTDSTLSIATKGTKRYPSQTYQLKKMKFHGKFIGA